MEDINPMVKNRYSKKTQMNFENQIICGDWHNCYDDGWQGIIVPEAFAHPAKMSYGLTRRIFKHALSEQWIKPGDVVVDPFGGIGSTGLVGASLGLRVVCVELEPKFVELGKANFERNQKAIDVGHFGHNYQPVMIQGDSRQLSEIIGRAECIVSSPPYAESLQIETEDQTRRKQERIAKSKTIHDGRRLEKPSPGKAGLGGGYGNTPGNIAALPPGKVAAIISSPPYEKQQQGGGIQKSLAGQSDYPVRDGLARCKKAGQSALGFGYGNQGITDGQLGKEQGETFWSAAQQIVSECHKILKPGGHAIWVLKAFVRKGKLVDFPGDWRLLCESLGFETVHEHHALLLKETRLPSLFGGEILSRKKRNSFFRNLTEKKAAWQNYWPNVPKDQQVKWLTDAELFLIEQHEKDKRPTPTEKQIFALAQGGAFKASGEDEHVWNENVRIDYEVVLCMRKSRDQGRAGSVV